MKKLLFAAFLAVSHCSLSQTVVPFPDSLASWTNVDIFYTFIDPWNPLNNQISISNVDEFCMNDLDTMINSINYKQLDDCSGNYLGAIRDSSGIVTHVPKDSTEAYLAYDFNAQMGDTMEIYLYDFYYLTAPAMVEVYVFGIDVTDVGDGINRKVIHLGSTDQYSQLDAISGIGSTSGLFRALFANVSNTENYLYCMTENDFTLYPYSSFGQDCGNVNVYENTMVGVEVYPNPANERLLITRDSHEGEMNIQILDATGTKVREYVLLNSSLEVNISDLSAGVYFVQMQKDSQMSVLKIVKE